MTMPARFLTASLAIPLLLAGCGSEGPPPAAAESDPAMSSALGEQIMVDPEMADQDGAAVAANGGQITLPPEDRSPEAVEAARKQAAQLVGGAIMPLPQPSSGSAAALSESVATAAQVAEAAQVARTDCSARVQYSNTWAARLPAALPVYPRGSVQEAAGIDADGCALRVVNFLTPVAPAEVMGFYYTAARRAGYGATYKVEGSEHVLGGRKRTLAYAVYARKLESGITEVDVVTGGK